MKTIKKWWILLFICVLLCTGFSTPALSDSPAKGEESAFPEKVIALSKSNAELWLLAGGSLVATSEDAMDLEGISPETVSLGDMDHVSLEAAVALEPDMMILFSTDPAQKVLGEAAEGEYRIAAKKELIDSAARRTYLRQKREKLIGSTGQEEHEP